MNCLFDTRIYNKIQEDPKKELIIKEISKRKMTAERIYRLIVKFCGHGEAEG
jgi:hypothetical protein